MVTLTPSEEEFALRCARERKVAAIREQLWFEYINRPKELNRMTADTILHLALKKASELIVDFDREEFIKTPDFEIYKILALYFVEDTRFESYGYSLKKGLILFGPVGCGKTTAINIFRTLGNPSFPIISCQKIANDYKKKDGIDLIEKYISLNAVCFDDFGTESTTKNFGDEKNVMAEVLFGRYEKLSSGVKTHLTTNIDSDTIAEWYGDRIRSRMREMFNQIEFPETSTDKRK